MAASARRSSSLDPAPNVFHATDEQAEKLDEVLVERAKQELVDRYGFLLSEAFEVLSALARSQQRPIEEFAESVVESGGRLDGESSSVDESVDARPLSVARSVAAELLVEAPSAAAAFLLAGSLADYAARAVQEDGRWRVVVQRCSASREGVPGALSRVRMWLADCGYPTASVTLDGETYLLDGSPDGAANGNRGNDTPAEQKTN